MSHCGGVARREKEDYVADQLYTNRDSAERLASHTRQRKNLQRRYFKVSHSHFLKMLRLGSGCYRFIKPMQRPAYWAVMKSPMRADLTAQGTKSFEGVRTFYDGRTAKDIGVLGVAAIGPIVNGLYYGKRD